MDVENQTSKSERMLAITTEKKEKTRENPPEEPLEIVSLREVDTISRFWKVHDKKGKSPDSRVPENSTIPGRKGVRRTGAYDLVTG